MPLLLFAPSLQFQGILSDPFHGLPVVGDTQLALISELTHKVTWVYSQMEHLFLIFKIKLSVVLQCIIPALERWRKKESNILGYPWLHSDLEASLDYLRFCLKK